MRQVVVIVRCDICSNEMKEDDATVIDWSWRGTRYQVEVDQPCLETVVPGYTVTQLQEVSTKVELNPAPAKVKPTGKGGRSNAWRTFKYEQYEKEFGLPDGKFQCPLCSATRVGQGNLRGHVWDSHGERLWQILADRLGVDY